MARTKVHKCIRDVNRCLVAKNTRLTANLLDPNTIFVDTERIERKRGSKAAHVIATYCPFCGERLPVGASSLVESR